MMQHDIARADKGADAPDPIHSAPSGTSRSYGGPLSLEVKASSHKDNGFSTAGSGSASSEGRAPLHKPSQDLSIPSDSDQQALSQRSLFELP